MTTLNRRSFLNALLAGTGGLALGFAPAAAAYTGRLVIFVQVSGGWDTSSYCDPKENTPGEPVINHWAQSAATRQAGNVPYATFANNQTFFDKYYDRMLVINGIDAQTGSHTVGVVHNTSGRISEGYPTLTALAASEYAPELPLAYINSGGYSETGGLIRYTRAEGPSRIRNIAEPTLRDGLASSGKYIEPEVWSMVQAARASHTTALNEETGLLPRAERSRANYASALSGTDQLKQFAAIIPPESEIPQTLEGPNDLASNLKRQAQFALLAFKSGVAVSADLLAGGFDTHTRHDVSHEWLLTELNNGIDYLWDTAESLELADRLFVVIASDFARTPYYNAVNGKDHHPIGSVVVMEKNQPWTNRVVGETDGAQGAFRMDPTTLLRDDVNGSFLYPRHVHKALRAYLGLGASPGAQTFPFANTEDFAFFG